MIQENLKFEQYRTLQQHYNDMPVGFPPTKSGSDIRLLQYFFDPEDIPILLELNHNYNSTNIIIETLKKKKISQKVANRILDKLVKKGLIGWKQKDNEIYYKLLPLVVGLDESQNYNRTPEYIELLKTYMIESQFALKLVTSRIPQLRTIPVEKSIEFQHFVNTYNGVRMIIENVGGPIVLLDCICKKSAKLNGRECKQTSRLETCLVFNEVAQRWLTRGLGTEISKNEALDVLKKNQADGLVLQPSNSKNPNFLCSCCGCCCGILSLQKMIPNPAKYWNSDYQAEVNLDVCGGCGTCIKICQVNAINIKNEKAIIDLKRCIGCGTCVNSCPNNSISLIKRKSPTSIPDNGKDLYDSILKSS
jgi:ferredoxin/DNA-binding MarR family transcriptional regulator